MNAVIYIAITDQLQYTYSKPVLVFARQHIPDTIIFDFDNHSEAVTAGYAIEIVQQAQKVVIILELEEGSTGPVLLFLEKILNQKEKCLVLTNGANRVVERMLSVFNEQQIKKDLAEKMQQEEISNYLS